VGAAGIVALVGAVAFLVTFLTLIAGAGEDSVFGYGFLPGILALAIWSTAASAAPPTSRRRLTVRWSCRIVPPWWSEGPRSTVRPGEMKVRRGRLGPTPSHGRRRN
jgi:hypothetical protein